MSSIFKTIDWKNDQLYLIDQRKLPSEETDFICKDVKDVAFAIKDMVVRGAPAIGVTAAFGLVLMANHSKASTRSELQQDIDTAYDLLFATRPTAVNLRWALDRMRTTLESHLELAVPEMKSRLYFEAQKILQEDVQINERMGENGAQFIEAGKTYLTHCNAGALATAGHGTALGVFYSAKAQGKEFQVFADETRPFLQGARLTAWELSKNNISTTLITDNMAGHLMKQGLIHGVVVGTDRVAANGDVANKIGTYTVAVLAKQHNIPFYVAAPTSTIDMKTATGDEIPIEERPIDEVINFYQQKVAPDGINVRNPAFDVTPHELVTAIITEQGVVQAPYQENLAKLEYL